MLQTITHLFVGRRSSGRYQPTSHGSARAELVRSYGIASSIEARPHRRRAERRFIERLELRRSVVAETRRGLITLTPIELRIIMEIRLLTSSSSAEVEAVATVLDVLDQNLNYGVE